MELMDGAIARNAAEEDIVRQLTEAS